MSALAAITAAASGGAILCAHRAVDRGASGGEASTVRSVRTASALQRRDALPARWSGALAASGLDGDPRRWARVGAATLGLVAIAATLVAGPLAALVAVVAAVLAAVGALQQTRGRGALKADAALPELIEHIGRGIRSGLDLPRALDGASSAVPGLHSDHLAAVVTRLQAGADLDQALARWAEAHDRAPVRAVVAALAVSAASGGARASALDGVAASLRARLAVDAEVRSLASQASASAAVLIALPVVFGVVGSVTDPRLAHTLFGTAAGLACVAGAVVLDGLGALWMSRVLRAA